MAFGTFCFVTSFACGRIDMGENIHAKAAPTGFAGRKTSFSLGRYMQYRANWFGAPASVPAKDKEGAI